MQPSQAVLIEELSPPPAPFQLFLCIASEPYSFILDSPESDSDNSNPGRYSFLGCNPFLVIKSYQDDIFITQDEKIFREKANPLDMLGDLLKKYQLNIINSPVPLISGAVGYIGYEMRHFIEKVPGKNKDDLFLPHLYFAFYDCILAYDHIEKKGCLISSGLPEEDEEKRLRRARERIREFKHKLERGKRPFLNCSSHIYNMTGIQPESNFTREEYLKAVLKVKEFIAAGDIFQANLSQRFAVTLPVSPLMLYSMLREVNPSPFSAFLNYPEGVIACSSPERFLKVKGDMVETMPIKGTRPRGKTREEDQIMAQALLSSAKDRAENIMIVDLERNDLGRVCQYGSVKVDELTSLETFPTVFHLTSTISGKLQPGKSIIDLLKATFPGGSITGAPKVRAMEIIDELEPNRRGPYTGSLGYISFNGNADLNIIIRTFILKGNKAYFNVGGGIVHDSQPEVEYQETLDKARGLLKALNLERISTCGFNNR